MGLLKFVLQRNSQVDSSFSWFIAICGCLYCTIVGGFYLTSGALFVLVQDRYDVSKQQASYPINTLTSVQFISRILSGPVLYKLKERNTLILMVFLGVLGSCMSVFNPLTDPITWLTICMSIRGFAGSFSLPVVVQVVSSHFQRHRAKALMIVSFFYTVSSLTLPSIIRIAAEEYGLESSWFIHAAIYCQAFVLALIIRSRQSNPISNEAGEALPLTQLASEKPTKVTQEGLISILKSLLVQKRLYIIGIFTIILMSSNSAFRTTIVDYGRDINVNNLNKYIFEIMAFADVIRIPIAMLIDSRLCYEETIILFSSLIAALSFLFLTISWGYVYVAISFLYSLCYAVGAACHAPIIATLGTSRIAIVYGLISGTHGILQLGLPILIGLFRDVHGTYNYLYYVFAILNVSLAVLLALSRWSRWFTHSTT